MAQIIPKNRLSVETNWQKELALAYTTPEALLDYLELDREKLAHHSAARRLFPMRVPRHFASLMEKGNWHDPLLRQVIPLSEEFKVTPGYSIDPLEEHNTAGQGLLHKYKSRVLLIIRGGCAVNCRYCFRRHFPYQDHAVGKQEWQTAIEYIAKDANINEVIFSGGDPLMAKDTHLAWLAERLAAIPHIKRLRIHTRLPVVMPSRIDSAFEQWFTGLPLQKILVLHANHSNEISAPLKARMHSLRSRGVTLLNQAVLLKGVNDSADALCDLQEAVFDAGVLPYYLYLLDKVQGASHFEVSDEKARKLIAQVIKRLPGFLVPKLTREIGGQPGKTPVDLHIHP
ncbi:EF-P beta-lysylation protein EpmB [Aestuariibacter sp. A3R04]|uniref:EF-P beta-lysylation protein EpmB n=1 Tax=Aestuariibacter sp. A3R04 TaxID=2841571 RepID=UPI001C0A28BC|nr:EF-P beta-lysylation protein EpmB [Aestuariibacter sp. A3R04]